MGLTHIKLNIANPAKPKRAVELSFLVGSGALHLDSVVAANIDATQHGSNYRHIVPPYVSPINHCAGCLEPLAYTRKRSSHDEKTQICFFNCSHDRNLLIRECR